MANITVSANTTVVNVDSTTNTIQVGTTTSNVVVGQTTFVANNIVRAAISVANNGGDGSLSYDEPTGVITYNGVTAAETRAHFSGSNGIDYNSSTGAITADTAEIRGFLGNTLPITYDNATGVIGFDANLDDLTLKKYQETIVDNGIDLGDISVNINDGTVHQFVASGNITGITLANIAAGGSATIFLTQDGIGDAELDLTTTPGNWSDWKFTTGYTNLSTGPNQWNALNVFYDGTNHYATLITEDSSIVQNSDLANSNVIVNGTTITLGGSGNISNFGALTTSDLTEGTNLYYTTARQNTDFDTRLATKSTTDLTEGTNLYFTNARANTVIGTNTTDNLSEGSTNLYYADARSRAALIVTTATPAGSGGLSYSDITGVFTFTPPDLSGAGAVTSVNGATGVVVLDTDDISEGSANLYYTQGRFDTAFTAKDTDDLSQGTTNLYYSQSRTRADVDGETASATPSASGTLVYDNTTGMFTYTPSDVAGIAKAALSVTTATPSGDGALAYNSGTGVFTFTPADAGESDYGNVQVADFLANGFGSNTITTTGDITTTGFFEGVLNGAVTIDVYNNTGSTLNKGQAVYLTGGHQGDNPHVALADSDDATKMPAIGVIRLNINAASVGQVVTSGVMADSSHGYTQGADLYISTAGGLTTTIPTGESALLQKIGKVVSPNHIIVQGAFRTNATPNLNDGNIFIGNAANQATTIDLDAFTYPISSDSNITSTANIQGNYVISDNSFVGQRADLTSFSGNAQMIAKGGVAAIESWTDAAPELVVETNFVARQASTAAANVWSVPRFATVKFADSDFANGTLGQTSDGIFTSTQDHKAYRNVQFRYGSAGGPIVSSIGGNHAVASIVTLNASTSTTVQSTVGISAGYPADLFAKADICDGTMVFRTQQTAVAQAMDDELQFPHNETIDYANSTVAYMNSNFNIGREDDGTSYSFPKTAGSARDYLRLGGTGTDLEFANAFAGLVSDEGTVVGDLTLDIATGDIFNVETAGDITDLILSNAPIGTRATIIIKQGSTTGALTGSTSWLWAGGNKTLSTSTGDIDVIKVTYDGTNYLGELTTGYVA